MVSLHSGAGLFAIKLEFGEEGDLSSSPDLLIFWGVKILPVITRFSLSFFFFPFFAVWVEFRPDPKLALEASYGIMANTSFLENRLLCSSRATMSCPLSPTTLLPVGLGYSGKRETRLEKYLELNSDSHTTPTRLD